MTSWLQAELTVPASAVQAVEQALEELGALSVALADPGSEPILEPAPGAMPLWQHVTVTALLPAQCSPSAVRRRLRSALGGRPPRLRLTALEERDWVREFREQLRPARFGARLWICPPGEDCPDAAAARVTLEPGLAFGSGSHPTTALCLEWLAGLDLEGRAVLDWGCGSGVLAISALALGAERALGVDIDPQALEAARSNALRNGQADRLSVALPTEVPASARYDVVVANILADTLVGLAPILRHHCSAGARVALSGILAAQADGVRAACTSWFDLGQAVELNGWALLTGTPVPGVGPGQFPESGDVHPLPEL